MSRDIIGSKCGRIFGREGRVWHIWADRRIPFKEIPDQCTGLGGGLGSELGAGTGLGWDWTGVGTVLPPSDIFIILQNQYWPFLRRRSVCMTTNALLRAAVLTSDLWEEFQTELWTATIIIYLVKMTNSPMIIPITGNLKNSWFFCDFFGKSNVVFW